MKKLLLSLIVALGVESAVAQQFVVIDGQAVKADDIADIQYVADEDFKLLSEAIALDEKTTLFSEALKLTGLADSLVAYNDYDYYKDEFEHHNGRYNVDNHYQYAEVLRHRFIQFTAFVETDDVFAKHGITSIDELKQYAKRVYDDVYPEDANISDPTDRRHSLNRFVAYHLLPFGATRETLTAMPNFFDQSLEDVSDWYTTLMPHASLKVSRPRTGNNVATEIGLFLNRRGLQNGPDRYGVQIPGSKISEEMTTDNGSYFYIDDLLCYDRTTQEVTLQERWRVDFVTLSPDFMTTRTRANVDWNWIDPDRIDPENPALPAKYFLSDFTQKMSWNVDADLLIGPTRFHYWNYGGDEVVARSDNNHVDLTVDLPALPAGDWELRLGTVFLPTCPMVRICLDDELLCDSVDLDRAYGSFAKYGWSASFADGTNEELLLKYREQIRELLLTLPLHVSYPAALRLKNGVYVNEWGDPVSEEILAIVATHYRSASDIDALINEKVFVSLDENRVKDMLSGITYEYRQVELNDDGEVFYEDRLFIEGTDEEVKSLPQYQEAFKRELYRLNGLMPGPREYNIYSRDGYYYFMWSISNSTPADKIETMNRHIVGRFHSDGKTDHKLRISTIHAVGASYISFDYLEFCPVSVADHPTVFEY